jgi:predicted membrane-bound dolichyl-phosphate-mannose-protein mannosyltransferase
VGITDIRIVMEVSTMELEPDLPAVVTPVFLAAVVVAVAAMIDQSFLRIVFNNS